MIANSDNTATDHLMHRLGRKNVERRFEEFKMGNPSLAKPLLTTREMTQFRARNYPKLAYQWLQISSEADRRAYLRDVIAPLPMPGDADLNLWGTILGPRDIEDIEWHFSSMDICNAYAGIQHLILSNSSLAANMTSILSADPGLITLNATEWKGGNTTWYKAGWEPGVMSLAYSAETVNGTRCVVSLLFSNPEWIVHEWSDDSADDPEAHALAKGALTLLLDQI